MTNHGSQETCFFLLLTVHTHLQNIKSTKQTLELCLKHVRS